jgi:hypothetical protein
MATVNLAPLHAALRARLVDSAVPPSSGLLLALAAAGDAALPTAEAYRVALAGASFHEGRDLLALMLERGLDLEPVAGAVLQLARVQDRPWDDERPVEDALVALGPVLLPRSLALLGDAEFDSRVAGRRALRACGAAAMPALLGLLSQDDRRLRVEAMKTLERMGAVAVPALPRLAELAAADDGDEAACAREAIGEIRRRSDFDQPVNRHRATGGPIGGKHGHCEIR